MITAQTRGKDGLSINQDAEEERGTQAQLLEASTPLAILPWSRQIQGPWCVTDLELTAAAAGPGGEDVAAPSLGDAPRIAQLSDMGRGT